MANSSTKKAAKLAQKTGGRAVRFQGGTVFPIAVALVLVVGIALIVYGRQTLPAADASEPTINDHWHAAYGFNICGEWYQLAGNLEDRNDQGQYIYTNFLRTGIHSHDDGVIHWHPNTSRAVGNNAVLGVFLDSYEVELDDDRLAFPPQNVLGFTDEYVEGETQCDGQDASLSVKVWESFTDTDGGQRYIANMDRIRVDRDGMVFGIYFGPDDMDQSMPPWAQQLPQLGAIDSGQILPEDLLQSDVTIVDEDGEVVVDPDNTVPPTDAETGDTGSVPDTGTVPDAGTVPDTSTGATESDG